MERNKEGHLDPVSYKHDLKTVEGMIKYLKGTMVKDIMVLKARKDISLSELSGLPTVKRIVYDHYENDDNFNDWLNAYAEELVNDGWLPIKK